MDPPRDEKKAYALVAAVAANRDSLRVSINDLRRIHDCIEGAHDSSINLIAQLTALKSNLSTMQDWLDYAIHDLHSQLLSDLHVLTVSCALLVRHLDHLIRRLGQPARHVVDFATKLKYAVAGRAMNRLRDVAQRQNDAVTLLLAACKW